LKKPIVVAAAGTKPKRIEEFIGRISPAHKNVSIARLASPGGWHLPAPDGTLGPATV